MEFRYIFLSEKLEILCFKVSGSFTSLKSLSLSFLNHSSDFSIIQNSDATDIQWTSDIQPTCHLAVAGYYNYSAWNNVPNNEK